MQEYMSGNVFSGNSGYRWEVPKRPVEFSKDVLPVVCIFQYINIIVARNEIILHFTYLLLATSSSRNVEILFLG
jgi:hypothetical protein